MAALGITREQYRDKVYGGWLGKNIGGTLGAPFEGSKEIRSLEFYDPVPGQAAANDGLDFQLVWLSVLRGKGIDVTSDDLAGAWQAHITYPWDEYGWASANVRRGFRPPITGSFDNWFRHGVRAMNRCELWAMSAPGAPQIAAAGAYSDAIIDHTEEGVWAAMFWAAMESAAFFLADSPSLLDTGLAMIPPDCRVAQAVRIARDAFREQLTPLDARGRIINALGADNYSDAPQNVGFGVMGLLYGKGDFGASVCTATNLGYSAQATGGSLGALLGILCGRTGIPSRWAEPIGDSVVLGWGVVGLEVERTAAELTEHTVEIGEKVNAARCPDVALVDSLDEIKPPVEALAPLVEPPPAEAPPPAIVSPPAEAAEPPAVEPASPSGFVAPDLSETAPAAVPDETSARMAHLEIDTPEAAAAPSQDNSEAPSAQSAEPAAAEIADSATQAPSSTPEPVPAVPPAVNWRDNTLIQPLLAASPTTAIHHAGDFEFVVDYGAGGPAIIPNVATSFTVAIRNLGTTDFVGTVNLAAPEGWQVAVPGAQGQRQMLASGRMARYGFVLRVPDTVNLEARNEVTLALIPEQGPSTTVELPYVAGSCWRLVGPFKNQVDEGFDHPYQPEDKPGFDNDYLGRSGGLIRWQKMAFRESALDLESIFNGSPGVAYGITTLHVVTPAEVRIVAHTNDGVKVWLNEQRIMQRHSHESFRPTLGYGPAAADVTLKAGDNRLMVKIVSCSELIQFALTVTDRDGRPIDDLGNTRW